MPIPLDRATRALADRYTVRRELGHGGMATVFLADDPRHEREVAIKLLHPELAASLGAERFLREIRTISRLQHPNILQLFDSGEADGLLYYVMPYVAGESLRTRLRREHELPVRDVVRLLGNVLDALAVAHRAGIVHRDIKPDNVLLSGRQAIVADFGIARAIRTALTTAVTLETTGAAALGTPTYMAPEQLLTPTEVDGRADLYAVGVMAYEMLAGDPPFVGAPADVLAMHAGRPPEPLAGRRPAVPAALDALIMRALAKLPADRWQDADEMLHALEAVQTSGAITPVADLALATPVSSGRTTPAATTGAPPPVAGIVPRARWAVVGAVGALAAAGLVAVSRRTAPVPPAVPTQLTTSGNVWNASIAPAGDFIAIERHVADGVRIDVRDLATGLETERFSNPVLRLSNWSPDGSQLLVAAGERLRLTSIPRVGGSPQQWMAGGGGRFTRDGRQFLQSGETARALYFRPITNSQHQIAILRFTGGLRYGTGVDEHPSGRRVAVAFIDESGQQGELWLVRTDSLDRFAPGDRPATMHRLLAEPGELRAPRWSPDGRTLYYLHFRDDGRADVRALPIGDDDQPAGPSRLAWSGLEINAEAPAWWITPDGRSLGYVRHTVDAKVLYLVRQPGGWRTTVLASGTGQIERPIRSPSGRELAWLGRDERGQHIMLVRDSVGFPRQRIATDSIVGSLVWAPDEASWLAVRRGPRPDRLSTINRGGGTQSGPFDTLTATGELFAVLRDGRAVLPDAANRQFRVVDPRTGRTEQLIPADTLRATSPSGAWAFDPSPSPDGRQVAFWWNRFAPDGGLRGLWVAGVGARRLRQLARGRVLPLGWSDDGTTVFAIDVQRARWLALRAADGALVDADTLPIEPNDSPQPGGAMLGDGRRLVLVGYTVRRDIWTIAQFDPAQR